MKSSSLKWVSLLSFLAGIGLLAGCLGQEDRTQAKHLAAKVHSHLRSAEFASIYAESAPRFKTVGSESQFVSQMEAFHKELGSFKDANEIGYQTGLDSAAGRTYVLVYKLVYEHGMVTERLTLVRSGKGEMQIWKLDLQPPN